MKQLDLLKRKLKTANDLQSIVKTMKGLAAVSINQYEHAVDSINRYFSTIESGLQIIMHKHPDITPLLSPANRGDEIKRIAIILGAGQPMCGAFNENLTSRFNEYWQGELLDSDYMIITGGNRISANLERHGWKIDHAIEMPTTIERINDTVQSLVLSIQQWNDEGGFTEVYLVYNRPNSNTSYNSVMHQILPVNFEWIEELAEREWKSRSIPTYTIDATELVSGLLKQLMFVSIYRAFSESLSAENSSRLSAMQSAERKITEMIDELLKEYRNQRQVNITEEILDIIASFEVVKGEGNQKSRF